MTALVPHSWLNRLGIPPWVWNPLSVSVHAAFEATIVVAVVGIGLGYLLAKGHFPGRAAIETLQREYSFYIFDEALPEVRWMTHWATTEQDVDEFADCIKRATA